MKSVGMPLSPVVNKLAVTQKCSAFECVRKKKNLYTLHAHKHLSMFVCTSSGLYRVIEHAYHTYSDCFGWKKKEEEEESKMATSGGLNLGDLTFMLFLKYIFLQIICC